MQNYMVAGTKKEIDSLANFKLKYRRNINLKKDSVIHSFNL